MYMYYIYPELRVENLLFRSRKGAAREGSTVCGRVMWPSEGAALKMAPSISA